MTTKAISAARNPLMNIVFRLTPYPAAMAELPAGDGSVHKGSTTGLSRGVRVGASFEKELNERCACGLLSHEVERRAALDGFRVDVGARVEKRPHIVDRPRIRGVHERGGASRIGGRSDRLVGLERLANAGHVSTVDHVEERLHFWVRWFAVDRESEGPAGHLGALIDPCAQQRDLVGRHPVGGICRPALDPATRLISLLSPL